MDLILAFAPFLSFALLERSVGTHGALLAATLVAGLLVGRDRWLRHRSFKLLEVGSLILFGALTIATRFSRFNPSILAVRLWVDGGLFVIVAGSILVGRPFSLQYAQERVSADVAGTPRFRSMNIKISAAWALAFAVIVIADVAMIQLAWFTAFAGTVCILGVLSGALWFTSWLPNRKRHA